MMIFDKEFYLIIENILSVNFLEQQIYIDTGIEKLTAGIMNFKEGVVKILQKMTIF